MIDKGEIVHCNITLKTKNKTIVVKEIVFSRPYDGEMKTKYLMSSNEDASVILHKFHLSEDVEIIKIDIIKSLGYKVKESGHSTIQKSETEKRQKNGTY